MSPRDTTRIAKIIHALAFILAFMTGCGPAAKPATEEEVVQQQENIRRATIVFGGDVMAHLPQVMAARRDSTYDFAETFRYIKPLFDSADLVIVNFETTVSSDGRYSGYPVFSSPPELAYALKESGVDVVMLANNHICDKGGKGLEATISTIEKAELEYTGAFRDSTAYRQRNPLRMDVNGIRLAILNYTYGTNGMPVPQGMTVNLIDTARIASDLGKIDRDSTDHIIAFFHWGVEYSRTPRDQERTLAEWCAGQGVDIVIGSHPHVLQPLETHSDTLGQTTGVTVYSLGNLVSNQRKRYTDGGMVARLEILHRDSLPAEIDASYMLIWTYAHYADGRKYYHILPSPVADTLLKSGTTARTSYDFFIDDSRKLIGDSTGFREIIFADTLPLPAGDALPDRGIDPIPDAILTPPGPTL